MTISTFKKAIFIFAMAVTSQLAQAADSIGIVAAIKGDVFVINGSNKAKLDVKDKVYENQTLVSEGESTAQLIFNDQSIFTLGHNTEIVLDKFVYDSKSAEGESVINVTKGFFRFITGKIAKKRPDQVKVNTPFATIGVRGSGGIGEVKPTGQTTVGLTVCCLDVSNNNGSVPLDRPNFFTEITSPSAAPSEPKPFSNAQLVVLKDALSTDSEEAAENEEQETEQQEGTAPAEEGGATQEKAPTEEGDTDKEQKADAKPKKKAAVAAKFKDVAQAPKPQAPADADAVEQRQPLAERRVDLTTVAQETIEQRVTDNQLNAPTNVNIRKRGFVGGFMQQGGNSAFTDAVQGKVNLATNSQGKAFGQVNTYAEDGTSFHSAFKTTAEGVTFDEQYTLNQQSNTFRQSNELLIARNADGDLNFYDSRNFAETPETIGLTANNSLVAMNGNFAVSSKPTPSDTSAPYITIYERTGGVWATKASLNFTGVLTQLQSDLSLPNIGFSSYGNTGEYNYVDIAENGHAFVGLSLFDNNTANGGSGFAGIILEFDDSGTFVRSITQPTGMQVNEKFGDVFKVVGNKLYAATNSSKQLFEIDLTDTANYRSVNLITGFNSVLAKMDANENFIVVRDSNGKTQLVNAQTFNTIQQFDLGSNANLSLAGDQLAIANTDTNKIELYQFNAAENKLNKTFEILAGDVLAIELTAEGVYINRNTAAGGKLYFAPRLADGTFGVQKEITSFSSSTSSTGDMDSDKGSFSTTAQNAQLVRQTGGCNDCQFVHWGLWNGTFENAGAEAGSVEANAAFVAGELTTTTDLNQLATNNVQATYSGALIGSLNNGAIQQNGVLNMAVDFNARNVSMDSSSFAGYSFANSNMGWDSGQNVFTGTFDVSGGSGSVEGAFFGPNAVETGGNFGFTAGADTASGIFIGKQN